MGHTMTGQQVAKEIEAQLRTEPNAVEGTLTCPDLKDELGEKIRCTRTVEGDGVRVTVGVSVSVKKPDREGNNLSFKVDGEPDSLTVLASALEDQVRLAAKDAYGEEPDTTDCPELPGKVGESVNCDFTVAGEPRWVQITVTNVEGTAVDFDLDELG